jgi:N6-L-threonylcarbamoyladenine synthase
MFDKDNFDFSFSGLKTAVLYAVQKLTANSYKLTAMEKEHICYEFEEAVVEVLVTKTMRAAEKYGVKNIVIAGGVSANKRLREVFVQAISNDKFPISNEMSRNKKPNKLTPKAYYLFMPPVELCGDNAAMIGLAAYYHILRGDIASWREIKVDSNLKL